MCLQQLGKKKSEHQPWSLIEIHFPRCRHWIRAEKHIFQLRTVWKMLSEFDVKSFGNIFRNGGVGGWRLGCMLMWTCVRVVQPSALSALSLLYNVRVWTVCSAVCVCPCCFCLHWPLWPQIYDRPPHQALQEMLFICLCMHLCVHF